MGEEVRRVLLVDDDEDEYLITRDLFAELGAAYAVTWRANFDEGLRAVRDGAFDAHLVDYHLGPRTGVELLKEARAAGCRAPILILTGAGDRSVDLEAMQAGASDYLDKGELTASLLERSLRYALERRRNEEELERRDALVRRLRTAELSLQEAVRTRDEFLGVASHELKTPLTPLRLQLDQLSRDLRDAPRAAELLAHLDIARRQVLRLGDLVDALLDVTRVAEQSLELKLEEMDLAEALRAVSARLAAQADAVHSKLLVEAPAPVIGKWDRARIQQVLCNLLSNALKYGRGQPVQLRAEAEGDLARVSVHDSGIGIDPEDVQRIFRRFERAVPSRHYGGLGLGLYLAHEIAQAHGGRIQVESTPGKGATFTLELPRAPR